MSQVPANPGLAFVVVQHLDPTHTGMLPELLQRVTSMKVCQIEDRTKVQRDCVYVIPPNRDLSILHGTLQLLEPVAPRGLRLPIDFFLRSLADDQHERAVGVILSGMGSDGTLGLAAIKGNSGLVLVQDPASAKFDSMPKSAIATGLADIVAPAKELPGRILAFLQHAPPKNAGAAPLLCERTQSSLEKVIVLLRARTRNDFSLYKRTTLFRRIERRMGIHQFGGIELYVRYLRENPHELDLLFKELLIGVTSFFRDPGVWEALSEKVLAGLLAGPRGSEGLRAWIPGCSTGEEAYTLAILAREAIEQGESGGRAPIQIFATDLDREAIDKARTGLFPPNIAADVSPERLKRFFVQEEHGYRASKAIREMLVFAPQNVAMDPPFTRLDLLSCRNLLIYLAPELQKKLLPLFHYSLKPGGALVLGTAETVGGFADLFEPIDGKLRLFRRKNAPLAEPIEFPSAFVSTTPTAPIARENRSMPKPHVNLETLAEQLILKRYSPATVLVTDQGDVVYLSARTGKYLEPPVGKANLNLFAMAREGLRHELSRAFSKALQQPGEVRVPNLRVGTNGGRQVVDLTVHALTSPEAMRGMLLVVFTDVAAAKSNQPQDSGPTVPSSSPRVAELEDEVQRLNEDLRSSREEMQSTNEELKSANEELQSTNEELQSTNEELTTSKEELQSLNEELQTLDAELQSKLDELSRANNDMTNLLNSTDIATIFLDRELKVRRYTDKASRVAKLIPSDAGRPLSDLAIDLDYSGLYHDAREVMRTLAYSEKDIATRDGRWFQVRIMPYRTVENMIDGLVLTFVDISVAKTLEAKLRGKHADGK